MLSVKYRRVLIWAAIGAVASLFLAHPPYGQHNPVDRVADRVVALFIWAAIGAVVAIIYTFFKGGAHSNPPTTIDRSAPPNAHVPGSSSTVQAQAPPPLPDSSLSPEEEMMQLGVTYNGNQYQYQTYRYDRLEDALNYARLHAPRPKPPAQPRPAAAPQPSLDAQMRQFGVTKAGNQYQYQTYRYDRLEDALNYARQDQSHTGSHR